MTTTSTLQVRRNYPLVAARTLMGAMGCVQAAGATFFLLLAPENAIWISPWIDGPVVAWTLTQIALHLVVAFAPGLSTSRRIDVGLVAVAMGAVLTPVKALAYDEPEAVTFLLVGLVLLGLLLVARRQDRTG